MNAPQRHDRSTAQPLQAERYEAREGRIFLSGIQALVRLPIEQMRRDAAAGLRTRGFISGYPGSPLGGYDLALGQAKEFLERYGVRHVPGQNEEMAASALMGTQMLDVHPHPDVDGVVGYWYGKGPGVDRAGDAFKHGNFAGTSRHGAVVVLSGEDHEAKSSSVPYQQEFAFEHYGIPVLYPSSVPEFLSFGLHAAAMSRYSGCWVALKLVGALCDGGATVDLAASLPEIRLPELAIAGTPFVKRANFKFFPILNVETERQLYTERHLAAAAYAQANDLNRMVVRSDRDRIGIIAAGKSYADMTQTPTTSR
jgi:indolepyruvate ferredoxin oxidoreductase